MKPDQLQPGELEVALLGMFAPAIRASVLENRSFREQYGLTVDANIRLDQIGVTFRRSALFRTIRGLYAGKMASEELVDTNKNSWRVALEGTGKVQISREDRKHNLPDFSCLIPDRTKRLSWFDGEVKKFGVNDRHMQEWRLTLDQREVEDEEVDQLMNDFRLTPRYVAGVVESCLRRQSISVSSIVPDDIRYYDRLIGYKSASHSLKEFDDEVYKPRVLEQLRGSFQDLQECFLLSANPFGPKSISFSQSNPSDILEFYRWLEVAGDRFSQLGGIEAGLANLRVIPELEPILERMLRSILSDKADDEDGRLNLLCSLIVLVDGELARTGICRSRPPYWRRLASIAHASVLERAIIAVNMLPADFTNWAMENRGLFFYLQTFIDMRLEPRWNPDFLLPGQLKAELVGRIAGVVVDSLQIQSAQLSELLKGTGADSIPAHLQFPRSFLPGPLEGGIESLVKLPDDMETELKAGLAAEELKPESFVRLVNSALIYRIDAQLAEYAADGLKRVKHQLRNIKTQTEAFNLLSGLATVAAVARNSALADELRVLMRVVRRKPGMKISHENAIRISLIAAAAHADLDKWGRYVGDCLTELSFEEMSREDAAIIRHYILALRQLEDRLWPTLSRADAATAGFIQSVA